MAKLNCIWIENTEIDIPKLRKVARGVALIPMGSIESHGPHLPVGSDTLRVEYAARRVAEREAVAVLPALCFTYVTEAQSLPGAIHMPSQLMMEQLEAICDELYRNGFDKIVLMHAHGGNGAHADVFAKRMLEAGKPYAVYNIGNFGGRLREVKAVLESDVWGHACEGETSQNMVVAPRLVKMKQLKGREYPPRKSPNVSPAQSPAWWVAAFPDMVAGYPAKATPEKGEKILQIWIDAVVEALRKIKADTVTLAAIRAHVRKRTEVRKQIEGATGKTKR